MCRRSELAVLERVDLQVEVNGFLTVVFRLSNSDQEGKVLSHQFRRTQCGKSGSTLSKSQEKDVLDKSAPRLTVVMVSLALAGTGLQAKAADPAAGRSAFTSTCSICHAVQPGKNVVGPSLFGVVGRKTGSVP